MLTCNSISIDAQKKGSGTAVDPVKEVSTAELVYMKIGWTNALSCEPRGTIVVSIVQVFGAEDQNLHM